MLLVKERIPISRLRAEHMSLFPEMIKADVDIGRTVLALDAELHADLEALLLEDGAAQEDIWGINIYPDRSGEEFIEFTSLINIRPSQGNTSMEVQDEGIREAIRRVVEQLIDTKA